MRASTALSLLLVLVSLGLRAPPARAAEPAEASAEAHALTAKAAALYDEGVAAYKKGQWAMAHAAFVAAWSLKKHWQIAANLADCELQLGKARDASEHAAFYLRNAPADRRGRAQALLDKATTKVGALVVNVAETGAEILVDGQPVGRAPLADPVFVEPGHHALEAHAGAKFGAVQVDVIAGAQRPVTIALKDPTAPPVVPEKRGPSLPLVVGGAAVGGASLVTGIALLAASASRAAKGDELLDKVHSSGAACASPPQAGTCSDLLAARKDQGTFHNVGVPMLVGGLVVGAATAVYALVPRSSATRGAGWLVVPSAGPSSGGVWVSGRF
jgi:hypothetical protein